MIELIKSLLESVDPMHLDTADEGHCKEDIACSEIDKCYDCAKDKIDPLEAILLKKNLELVGSQNTHFAEMPGKVKIHELAVTPAAPCKFEPCIDKIGMAGTDTIKPEEMTKQFTDACEGTKVCLGDSTCTTKEACCESAAKNMYRLHAYLCEAVDNLYSYKEYLKSKANGYYTNYSNETADAAICTFKKAAEITLSECAAYAGAYAELMRLDESSYFTKSESEVKLESLRESNESLNADLHKFDDLQRRWLELNPNNNPDVEERIATIEAAIATNDKEITALTEAAEKEQGEKTETYVKNITKLIKELENYNDKYKYKEFVYDYPTHTKNCESRVRNALNRKFKLTIPMFRIKYNTPEVRDAIRNHYVPAIRAIAAKYDEFQLLIPDFDENTGDTLKVFITLKEPFNDVGDKKNRKGNVDVHADSEKIKHTTDGKVDLHPDKKDLEAVHEAAVYCKSEYDVSQSGRFYVVTSPDGRFLGNCDSMEDADSTINEDISDLYRASQNQSMNEATLTTEEREKLDDSDYGVPEQKAYPLTDAAHVRKAIQLFPHCDPKYKTELVRNIAKKVIDLKQVGKITISDTNPNKGSFPKWMLKESKTEFKVDGNNYTILLDGEDVAHGTFTKKDEVKPTNESVFLDENGSFYLI